MAVLRWQQRPDCGRSLQRKKPGLKENVIKQSLIIAHLGASRVKPFECGCHSIIADSGVNLGGTQIGMAE